MGTVTDVSSAVSRARRVGQRRRARVEHVARFPESSDRAHGIGNGRDRGCKGLRPRPARRSSSLHMSSSTSCSEAGEWIWRPNRAAAALESGRRLAARISARDRHRPPRGQRGRTEPPRAMSDSRHQAPEAEVLRNFARAAARPTSPSPILAGMSSEPTASLPPYPDPTAIADVEPSRLCRPRLSHLPRPHDEGGVGRRRSLRVLIDLEPDVVHLEQGDHIVDIVEAD
jgi:hypothetical protein